MAPSRKQQKDAPSTAATSETSLVVTAQQSRFHTEATDPSQVGSKDLDIRDLNITIGNKAILSGAEVKLQYGVHYVLVGRNGVGKSTFLKSIGEKLIPAIPSNLRILLLGQTVTSLPDDEKTNEEASPATVLETVIRSDRHREQTMRDVKLLSTALDNTADSFAVIKAVRRLKHEQKARELEEAQKIAARRSGARGLKARKELREAEAAFELSELSLTDVTQIDGETIAAETQEAVRMLSDLENSLDAMGASTAESRARPLLLGLGFSPSAIDGPFTSLSGGWKTRCDLAKTLFQPSDYLLLDEPTNFLDLPAILWLQDYLKSLPMTIIATTHDRAFADEIAQELLVLRDKTIEHFHGNLTVYDTARREQQIRLTRMKDAQDRQKAHMVQTIQGNIRAAKTAGDDKKLKQAASRQRKLDERMGMEVSAKGTRFKLNRDLMGYHLSNRDEIEVPTGEPPVKMAFPKEPGSLRFPGVLVSFEGFSFRYKGGKSPVVRDVTFAIHPGMRMGILGLNGAGKSTLLAHVLGEEQQPLPVGTRTGVITRHPAARVGYFSQMAVEELHALGERERDATALSVLMRVSGGSLSEQEARGILGSLGLPGRTASDVAVSNLSGGQKVRLALANIFWSPPHLLVLDEVTTHLDSDSILVLAKELNSYEGAILLVTHDRFFMRSVVEGQNPFDEEGDGDDVDWNEEKKGDVWLLEKGVLTMVEGGVGAWEKKAMKSVRRALRGK